MPTAIEKWTLQYLIDRCPADTLALLVVAVLVSWLTYRMHTYIAKEQEQRARIAITEKQLHKVEQLLEHCPCITKKNATWLQDKTRNGGVPPDRVYCPCKQFGGENQ